MRCVPFPAHGIDFVPHLGNWQGLAEELLCPEEVVEGVCLSLAGVAVVVLVLILTQNLQSVEYGTSWLHS